MRECSQSKLSNFDGRRDFSACKSEDSLVVQSNKAKQGQSVLIKTESRLSFSLRTRISSLKAKSTSKAIRPDENRKQSSNIFELLRSSVCLFKEGGWHY
jgi:hypothetical protein